MSETRQQPLALAMGSRACSLVGLGHRDCLTRIRNGARVYTWNAENGFPSGFLLTCWKRLNSLLKRMHAPSMEK
jgi:hypothetical protein